MEHKEQSEIPDKILIDTLRSENINENIFPNQKETELF